VYGASIRSCRPCELREQCQWNGSATKKPRQVSVLLHPFRVGPAPLLWKDGSRRQHRWACRELVRDQHFEVRLAEDSKKSQSRPTPSPAILSRAQRAHFRLSWTERLTRNARGRAEGPISIKLFRVPDHCADFLGLRASSPVTQLRAMGLLSSDRQASPSGASWLLASALLRFLSSTARPSSFTAISLTSLEGEISLQAVSTPSLRPSLNHNLIARSVGACRHPQKRRRDLRLASKCFPNVGLSREALLGSPDGVVFAAIMRGFLKAVRLLSNSRLVDACSPIFRLRRRK
jgi:hypothetical protein